MEAYLTTVGCRESESDSSWKWLQDIEASSEGHVFRSEDARCKERKTLGGGDQPFDITRKRDAKVQPWT